MLLENTIIGVALPHLSPRDRHRAETLLTTMERSLPDDSLGLVYALARARTHGELALIRGDTKSALIAFRKADSLDAPLSAREYLARALLAAAAKTQNRDQSLALKNEALHFYGRPSLRPMMVWREAWDYPPGFVGDQMASYLNLAKSLGRNDAETQQVQSTFNRLRALPDSIEVPTSTGIPNSKHNLAN